MILEFPTTVIHTSLMKIIKRRKTVNAETLIGKNISIELIKIIPQGT